MAVSTGRTTSRKKVTKKVPKRTRQTKKKTGTARKKVSRRRKPDNLSLEAWQRELRRQYGREQDFQLNNIGDQPFFSEFHVSNPASKSTYRVAIRERLPGGNFCSCPDFATNSLGTCKHIEFTLGRLERKRGAKTAFRDGFHPPYSEIYLQYGARRVVRFRPGTECPAEIARLAGGFFDDEGTLRPDAFGKFEAFLSQAARIDHDLRCYDDTLAFIAEVRDEEHRRERVAEAFPRGIHSPRFKNLLRVPLYDYQREGALFAARAGRCLIGDEMGLGKTVEALAAAEIMAEQYGVERVLIVCPTSLKHQWEREIERFTKRSVTVVGGLRATRQELFRGDGFYTITNYDTVHRDLDLIANLAPDLVILDEAQRIKNWETRTARSVKQIKSPYCLVLTGTPLENRLEELVSIVEFIDKHRLGPTYRFLHEHQDRDDNGRVVGYRNLDRIGKTLEPILVRRRKKQVLDQLPERLEKHFFVPMTPQQRLHHDENREIVARVAAKWRRYGFLSEADQRRLMIALQNMRMSCNSTYLLDHETDFSVKPDELLTVLDDLFEQPETKAVIFSQWVRTHELSIRRFADRDWEHVFFHGGVESRKRMRLIDRFREDRACRVFLSTDAGGVGLNLQHANVVINMDLPWNPAVLEQRIGRVHRLGQTQPVQVIHFVSQGTIEEGMLSVLAFKKSLFAGVLDGGEKEVFLGGSRLKRFMETVEKVSTHIPSTTPEPDIPPEAEPEPVTAATAAESRETTAPAATATDPLAGLLQNGLALLEQLAAASQPLPADRSRPAAKPAAQKLLETVQDANTGRTYLKLPMPDPEILDRTLQAVGTLLDRFRK